MQTSCPECRTTFRVTQDQLGLRRGLVRCGTCNAVFNAYDTLLPELAEPPRGTAHVALVVSSSLGGQAETTKTISTEHSSTDASTPQPEPPVDFLSSPESQGGAREGLLSALHEITVPVSTVPPVQVDVALAGYQQAAEVPPATPGDEISSDAILLVELPHRIREEERARPRWKTPVYLFLSVLLLGLLGVQWAYFLRGNLVAVLPESRPWLEMLCQPLGCLVPLPEQLMRQAIVSSSLENDPEQKSRVRLSFLLANRTLQTQAWPHVVLTLVDVREAPVAQKAFPPEVYLPKPLSPRAGFAAHSEQEARVDLDIGSLAAASYVLNVVYP